MTHFKILSLDSCYVFFFIRFSNLNHIFSCWLSSFSSLLPLFDTFYSFHQVVPLLLLLLSLLAFFVRFHSNSCKEYSIINFLAKKHLNVIKGGRNALEREDIGLRSCNTWEINVWLFLEIRVVISSIHYDICDHSHGISLHGSSSTICSFMFKKKIDILPKPWQHKDAI